MTKRFGIILLILQLAIGGCSGADKRHSDRKSQIKGSYQKRRATFNERATPILRRMTSKRYLGQFRKYYPEITIYYNFKTKELDFEERKIGNPILPRSFVLAQSKWLTVFTKKLQIKYTAGKNISALVIDLFSRAGVEGNLELVEQFYRLYYKLVVLELEKHRALGKETGRYAKDKDREEQQIKIMMEAIGGFNDTVNSKPEQAPAISDLSTNSAPVHSIKKSKIIKREKNTQIGWGNINCGLKPLPEVGCRIGRCVNGEWEQVCDKHPGSEVLTCGLKPLPEVGCRIGRCVNGRWEQVCDKHPGSEVLTCGLKPLPEIGCRIGRCVNGRWEQVCN